MTHSPECSALFDLGPLWCYFNFEVIMAIIQNYGNWKSQIIAQLVLERLINSDHYSNALFNNMWTLKCEGRLTNAFFTAINQMFSRSSQLTTTAKHCFVVCTVHNDLSEYRVLSIILKRGRKLGGATEHLIDSSKRKHLSVEISILESAYY